MKINLQHGNGGRETSQIINDIFMKFFDNSILRKLEDAAVIDGAQKLAFTTDSFVVEPLFFQGGNIGDLCICGTVNDLAMVGATAKYFTIGFIIEQGMDTSTLERICESIKNRAIEANVKIVAGDTKVVGGNGGLYINTSGIGFVDKSISVSGAKTGSSVIISGNLGDHHAAILSARMGIENGIKSDVAPLGGMVKALIDEGIPIQAMRDITRGGLGGILNEIALSSKCAIEIDEELIPVSDNVRGLCDTLGLDPLYMGNEGKMALIVPETHADKAISIMRGHKYGENACTIGRVTKGAGVFVNTKIGGKRRLPEMSGDGLPRIC